MHKVKPRSDITRKNSGGFFSFFLMTWNLTRFTFTEISETCVGPFVAHSYYFDIRKKKPRLYNCYVLCFRRFTPSCLLDAMSVLVSKCCLPYKCCTCPTNKINLQCCIHKWTWSTRKGAHEPCQPLPLLLFQGHGPPPKKKEKKRRRQKKEEGQTNQQTKCKLYVYKEASWQCIWRLNSSSLFEYPLPAPNFNRFLDTPLLAQCAICDSPVRYKTSIKHAWLGPPMTILSTGDHWGRIHRRANQRIPTIDWAGHHRSGRNVVMAAEESPIRQGRWLIREYVPLNNNKIMGGGGGGDKRCQCLIFNFN